MHNTGIIMVNGHNFRRQQNRKPEPPVSLPQPLLAGLSIAMFVCGGLALVVAATA